ncbi:MAG: outer membrane beta-barrel protein [Alphaproteobacteria bacterium]|nr:outer membrane beta-barrel protein [Alphaproteobacteria bacterium]
MKMSFSFKACLGLSLIVCCLVSYPALAFDSLSGNWRGGYLGLSVGNASASFTNQSGVLGPSGSGDSLISGGDIGVNWETNRLVFGIEGDGAGLFINSQSNGVVTHETWMASIRGRAGYDVGRLMPYFTSGVAWTNTVSELQSGARSHEDLDAGLAIGGGLDLSLSPRVIGRIEYLHVDVPNQTATIQDTAVTGGSSNDIVRVGFNYRF